MIFTVMDISFLAFTLVLYILVVICLCRLIKTDSDFKGSFFKLIFNMGLIDLAESFVRLWVIQFPKWQMMIFFYEWCSSWLAKFLTYLLYCFSLAQFLSVLAVAIDRFLQFLLPACYLKWGHKTSVTLTCVSCWILAFVFTSPCLAAQSFSVNVTSKTIILFDVTEPPVAITYLLGGVFLLLSTLGVFVLYGWIFIRAACLYQEIRTDAAQKLVLGTAVIGFCMSVSMVVFFLWVVVQASGLHFGPFTEEFVGWSVYLVGSLFNGANPYFLLVLSPTFRERFKHFICCSSNRVVPIGSRRPSNVKAEHEV